VHWGVVVTSASVEAVTVLLLLSSTAPASCDIEPHSWQGEQEPGEHQQSDTMCHPHLHAHFMRWEPPWGHPKSS